MDIRDFDAIRISMASPEQILSWSYGEVTKPETINYRRLRPEKDGLFCEAIFGPQRDYQCYCGKYKKIRYRGIVCDKCGVEVTRARVRRERLGHIKLASPVAHIWYTRRVPSYLGLLLNISRRNLDRVLYFAQHIITHVDEEARQKTLRHLEEETERAIAREKKAVQERIDELTLRLEEDTEKVTEVVAATHQRLEEELAETANQVTAAGDAIQKILEERMGRVAEADIIFAPSHEVVVKAGEIIARDHFTLLHEIAKEAISQAEANVRMQQQQDRLQAELERENQQRAVEQQQQEFLEELETKTADMRARVQEQQRELKSLKVNQLLPEPLYYELSERWGNVFQAGMGAEAFRDIVTEIDLDALAKELRSEIRKTRSKQRRKKAIRRLSVVEALRRSHNRPEWMILTVLPVIPPDLRPMVQLDGGRFATSDLNDLYRRVINRNNRLKRLLELGAPDVIIRNEKRMLQEAVDSLIDNSRRGKATSARGRRKLKSLSDMLKGKQGRFRRNLLGKRVDYSGRSVIVVGPHLKLHQCGLPKTMALELFRPFVMRKLVEYEHAHNVKGAKRLIEKQVPEVWEVLEEIVQDYPILLNRAPTLHRLGIQAFQPVLVDGSAIEIHPLVCSAFNADFDGDQMAVHIPLSEKAKQEARELMMSRNNLLKPASGEPIVNPTKDMVLGCYYLTLERDGCKGEGKIFSDLEEVALAYELGKVELHAKIKVRTASWVRRRMGSPKLVDTTVGRALFNRVLPEELRYVNDIIEKGRMQTLIADAYRRLGAEATARLVDEIKDLGFHYATRSGLTIAVEDITVPEAKSRILAQVGQEVTEIERQYRRGLITEDEKYVKSVELWTRATDEITDEVARTLDPYGSIRAMAESGATKGGFTPVRQLAGMRGLMADPSGRIIDLPIRSNFREGLTALEYFISTHGARKGLADTALRTADAGYLTRRLVDVAQDAIITAQDCETKGGIWIRPRDVKGVGETLPERVLGRITAGPIVDPHTGKVIVEVGQLIEEEHLPDIVKSGVQEFYVRSPLTCQLQHGICAMCYGRDLARGDLVQIGEAVGVIAAQSIGEPGTQLTLRTFHTGGVAEATDITHGLPRVQELFEARNPRGEAFISDLEGIVHVRLEEGLRLVTVTNSQVFRDEYPRPGNYKILVEDGDEVEQGTPLAKRGQKEIIAEAGGTVLLEDKTIVIRREEREEREYSIPLAMRLRVEDGQSVHAGEAITEGPLNPNRILSILGRKAAQEYLLTEIQKVYRSQGVNINDKHVEVIVRRMTDKVWVHTVGDTDLLPGDLVHRLEVEKINEQVLAQGGRPASAQPVLLGITKAALATDSFLSASSFQHTINVLARAAIEGKVDDLRGLKENVILGKLIPAGTGYRPRSTEKEIEVETHPSEEMETGGGGDGQPPDEEIEALVEDIAALGEGEMDGAVHLPVREPEVELEQEDGDESEELDDAFDLDYEVGAEFGLSSDLADDGM